MTDFIVYLAGPITGSSYEGCTDWRNEARDRLASYNTKNFTITGASPMRHKDYLSKETSVADTYEGTVMSSQRGIFGRDRFDCTRSDALIVNMLGATRVSIGTVMEIAWANSRDIPIILVMEEEGNIHEHAMLREACYWRVNNLPEACDVAAKILLP